MDKHCASYRVPKEMITKDPGAWERIKYQLMSHYMRDYLPAMIGDGNHHIMKFDYAVLPCVDFGYTDDFMVEYRLYCLHSIADTQHITIPVVSFEQELLKEGAKRACRWCGNVLVLDKRGGCSACGGWVEDPKERDKC